MSPFIQAAIISLCQLAKLYILASVFDLVQIGEYAIASTIGISLTVILNFWMSSSVGIGNASTSDKIDVSDPRLILLIFAKFLCFMIVAAILYRLGVEYWTNSALQDDHTRTIIGGFIGFGPLLILNISTFARLSLMKKSQCALRFLSCASAINLLTVVLLIQWFGILAFFLGLIVGSVVFSFFSYGHGSFNLFDYVIFYSRKGESSLVVNIWLINGWLHIAILAIISAAYFIGLIENKETLAVIFLSAAFCFAACQIILPAKSMLVEQLMGSDRVWLLEDFRVYEKLIQLSWHLGTGVIATVVFLIPLASFTLPLEKRQLCIDSGWFLCILYWFGFFITPAYVLTSSHKWNRRLTAHIRATAIGILALALFGIYVRNVQGGLFGITVGLTLGAAVFSSWTHICARELYQSWMPENEGRGFSSFFFLVIGGMLVIPVTIDDVFVAVVFASYSIIVACLVFSYKIK